MNRWGKEGSSFSPPTRPIAGRIWGSSTCWRTRFCTSTIFRSERHRARLLGIENEGGHNAGGGGEAGLAGGKPTGTALHLAEVGVGVDIHLHLAKFQVAVGHQGEDRSHRSHPLLYHVVGAHGLFEGAVPTGAIHL